ncbi:mediator complex subunit [Aspergillus nanangensis]|uniref:Mediator of RNA polymerase II transcription subunit 14 n=1 Tax=Aspergillus nanangensis TaxID=2582783 RepID=A0AAD4GRM3_ASPNN|nr:mediator complex subunit [Aspergillus nanangensis]
MPGVVMDKFVVGGPAQGSITSDTMNGASPLGSNSNVHGIDTESSNVPSRVNGSAKDFDGHKHPSKASPVRTEMVAATDPPALAQITQGFFPFSKLINRSVQQCWNDLSDLVTELAEIQVTSQDAASLAVNTNGKSLGNQSSENTQKKLRILDFAHSKRAEFIKLLVLSQWSRQASDVSKLIDIQNFIRTRHQAYTTALQCIGDMKRDLVQAQVANPDLRTALEVLSRGKVASMPNLGYKPPNPLTAEGTLKRLQKLNRIISARLVLSDSVPLLFRTYRVHNGRVTFVVPDEFELDLSIGAEDESSQFYFVDIRFLFTPSSPIPKGRVFNDLDAKINEILRTQGLAGCFGLLHNLVLTNKVNALYKQAIELGRSLWSDTLRIELLHRTLVLQYWTCRSGPKSWLEIGIKSSRAGKANDNNGLPVLGLRWIRDGQEVDSGNIDFDAREMSMECVLRSVIALHICHILSSAYDKLRDNSLFSTGTLSLRALLSRTEPGACQLDIQLTRTRHLRVSIEPMSGASILSTTPSLLDRPDGDRNSDKSSIDDIVSRVARLRCISAIEEIESNARMLGLQVVNPRSLKLDFRRTFPPGILRFSFFWHRSWDRNWILAATSSMDGDNWWVVQLEPSIIPKGHLSLDTNNNTTSVPRSAQIVSDTFLLTQQEAPYAPFADLGHCLHGILTMQANARYLADLQSINFYPPLPQLVVGPSLRVPDITIRYQPSKLPRAFQMTVPAGLSNRPFIKETICLSFHGVDPNEKAAMLVAYGTFLVPTKHIAPLISKTNGSLVFQKGGNEFAIRLYAPVGRSVIPRLIENLRRLECVLSIIETLQNKKMEPTAVSLSHVAFLYGSQNDLSAGIDIELNSHLPLLSEMDPLHLPFQEKTLFQLRLGIVFNYPNPHRRIQRSFSSILNQVSAESNSLDAVAELLSLTLPLMQALDRLLANPTYADPLRIQVTARNAKNFRIHYPTHGIYFQLALGQHLSRMVWILKDVDCGESISTRDKLKPLLQESLYNSRGDGWRGLGNGVVSSIDKVGNLISELDKCCAGYENPETSASLNFGSQLTAGGKSTAEQTISRQTADMPHALASLANRPDNTNTQHQANVTANQNPDIIMID